jgi:hypothetical protein
VASFTTRPLYPQGKSPRYPLDRRLGAYIKYSNLFINILLDVLMTFLGLSIDVFDKGKVKVKVKLSLCFFKLSTMP